MNRLKTALSSILIFLLIGLVVGLFVNFFGNNWSINPTLHGGLFAVNLIGLLIILGFYGFTRYSGLGFVYLGLIVFKFFAIGYLFYRFRADFSAHIVVYFVLYWIYMLADMLLVIRLIKKQD